MWDRTNRPVVSHRGIFGYLFRSFPVRSSMFAWIGVIIVLIGSGPVTQVYAEQLKAVHNDVQAAKQGTKQCDPDRKAKVIPQGPDDVSARIKADSKPKEVTFDLPGVDRILKPWNDWKTHVAKQYGLRLGFDYQPVLQVANNTVGNDNAAGGIFRAYASWDLWSRDDPSRTGTLDVRVEQRHAIGTELPPELLAFNFGWAGTTAPDWTDQGWGLPVFILRQRLDIGDAPIELRLGRMSAFSQFDITPYSDNLTVFQNNSIILNPTIGYPSAGSLGFAGYIGIPQSKFYALGMIMDANGSYDELGTASLEEGVFFKALEFGWTDMGVSGLSYLFNNIHAAVWHTEEEKWGVALTGSYTLEESRVGVFARLGWASEEAGTLYDKYASAGVVKSVFRDSMIGLGASWGQPPNSDADQVAAEIFYRWQLAQGLALTPSIQLLFNPVLNPEDDLVTVFGLRGRVTF